MTEEKKREIVNSYLSGGTYATIRKQFGYSSGTIWKVLKEAGVCKGRGGNPKLAITDEQILKGIEEGLTRQEIADKYGTHVENLARRMKQLGVHARYARMKQLGVHARYAKKDKVFGESWHYIKTHDVKVREYQSEFTYIESRRVNDTYYIRVKCKYCGAIITRCDFDRRWKCECYSKRKKNEEEIKKRRVELARLLNMVLENKKPKKCKRCGEEFYSPYSTALYCSKKCKKGGSTSIRKRCKKYGVFYDPDVIPIKVFQRDHYKCGICGLYCIKDDDSWNGYFGAYSPTIDHIVALKNGGTHTWDNVQCAHAICNSNKRDLLTV